MDIIDLREYILSLPLVEECQPFGDDAVVYKVGGRLFACCVLEYAERVAVKCQPDRAVVLRDNYLSAVTPAWHFNKRYWSSVRIDSDLPGALVRDLIRGSYIFTIRHNVTPKARREELLRTMGEE